MYLHMTLYIRELLCSVFNRTSFIYSHLFLKCVSNRPIFYAWCIPMHIYSWRTYIYMSNRARKLILYITYVNVWLRYVSNMPHVLCVTYPYSHIWLCYLDLCLRGPYILCGISLLKHISVGSVPTKAPYIMCGISLFTYISLWLRSVTTRASYIMLYSHIHIYQFIT